MTKKQATDAATIHTEAFNDELRNALSRENIEKRARRMATKVANKAVLLAAEMTDAQSVYKSVREAYPELFPSTKAPEAGKVPALQAVAAK